MNEVDLNAIIVSWNAEIIPSKSLAGIPIGLNNKCLMSLLSKYIVDKKNSLYKFESSPILKLEGFSFDNEDGSGDYHFIVSDASLTNRDNVFQLKNSFFSRALHIGIRDHKVFFIKVWAFEVLDNNQQQSIYSYQGRTKENLGLYSEVKDFENYSKLEFDEAEEWFYTDPNYGGLEITGYCQSLEDIPDQSVTAITVIPKSAYMLEEA